MNVVPVYMPVKQQECWCCVWLAVLSILGWGERDQFAIPQSNKMSSDQWAVKVKPGVLVSSYGVLDLLTKRKPR